MHLLVHKVCPILRKDLIWIEDKYMAIFVKVDLFSFVRLDGMLVHSKIWKYVT